MNRATAWFARRRGGIRDERGITLVELLMTMFAGAIVMGMIVAMATTALHNNSRVTYRVAANQRARPVMTRLMDQLHSVCVAPGFVPLAAGSTSTSLNFKYQTGSAVQPIPALHSIRLETGNKLTERIYPANGGASPSWTYATNPTSNRLLLDHVSQGINPVFRYYTYQSGQISSTPLPTPLSTADATRTIQVAVSLDISPTSNAARDANAALTLSDSAVFRLSPASEDNTQVNGPCA